ncbi:MAG: GTPase domain-containing protein [Leptolyngbyaceae cyanobacterium SM1_4_3]|nr:GTPase domain-containing protein [Leptolyngbyaceae cyanobacterium SM1_4_3]
MMNLNLIENTINVVVVGITGHGKSTLINAVLNVNASETGVGKPVTQEIFAYSVLENQLRLFDTKGFEVQTSKETVETIEAFINERSRDADINKRMHCMWLCVSADSSRWEKVHQKFVSLCGELDIPCIVIVTQSYGGYEEFVKIIQVSVPKNVSVIPTVAKALGLPDGSKIEAYGISDLTEQSINLGNSFKSQITLRKTQIEKEESLKRAQTSRKKALRKAGNVVNKTIGGTVSALGLLIVLVTSTGFEKCGDNPGFWSWLTNRSEHEAAISRYEQCSSRNSTLTWTIMIFLSGSAFVVWYTFLRTGKPED